MARHEHIYEMSGNPFLIAFASLFHSVYHTYFTSITQNEVVKLDLHQPLSTLSVIAMAREHLTPARRY